MKVVAVSGGFDPLHVGHLELFRIARRIRDFGRLAVIVNADEWVAKKHPVLLPQKDRVDLLASLRIVEDVWPDPDVDGDVSGTLEELKPDVFVVGPDHVGEIQEQEICREMRIEIVRIEHSLAHIRSSDLLAKFAPKWNNPSVTVSALAIDGGRVLLQTRRDGGKLELPGGFLEEGETLEQCMLRELQEETGASFTGNPLYLGSWMDQYQDGRPIIAAVFMGILDRPPQASKEAGAFQWVEDDAPPPEKFFARSDWRAVDQYFRSIS